MIGDFNVDWQSDFYKSKLESILNDNGLKQILKVYTRIKIVDYIIANNKMMLARININKKISDGE